MGGRHTWPAPELAEHPPTRSWWIHPWVYSTVTTDNVPLEKNEVSDNARPKHGLVWHNVRPSFQNYIELWWHRREMFFLVKRVLIQPLKSQNLTNLKCQFKKNIYPPLAKTFTKGYYSVVTHVLYHFCHTSLITACAIFYSLKFHVVCTCTFFGDTICLLTNQKMIEIVTLIDSHIVLTYDCWNCFLVFNIWASHALEMTIIFHYPTLELFCFSFTQPFTHSKFCLPNPFLFGATSPP
jgi:hypothetical protein